MAGRARGLAGMLDLPLFFLMNLGCPGREPGKEASMERTVMDRESPSLLRQRWRALCEELAVVSDARRGVVLRELDQIERSLQQILLSKRQAPPAR